MLVADTPSPSSIQYYHLWGEQHTTQLSSLATFHTSTGAGLVPEGMDFSLQITTHLLQLKIFTYQTVPAGGMRKRRGKDKRGEGGEGEGEAEGEGGREVPDKEKSGREREE